MIVYRRTGGLNNEQIPTAHRFRDMHVNFAVGELGYFDFAQLGIELFGDRLCKFEVRVTRE